MLHLQRKLLISDDSEASVSRLILALFYRGLSNFFDCSPKTLRIVLLLPSNCQSGETFVPLFQWFSICKPVPKGKTKVRN